MGDPYRAAQAVHSGRRLRRLLVAIVPDAASRATIEAAARLAHEVGASVHVLYVLEALMYATPRMAELAARDPETHPAASRHVAEAVQAVRALGVDEVSGSVEFGIAADVILRHANDGSFDLLVLGAPAGGGGLRAHVLPRSAVPVLVVPA